MELVIRLSDKEYSELRSASYYSFDKYTAYLAMKNGTPLPEHHGKLKDADELYSIFKENCNAYNIDNLSFISDMDMNFDLVPTIIEGSDSE